MGLGYLLAQHYNVSQYIEPRGPLNFKLNRDFNTNYANISKKQRISQILKLDGSSQQIQKIRKLIHKYDAMKEQVDHIVDKRYSMGFDTKGIYCRRRENIKTI
jgi:uncharacterized protein (UPF0335 family)